MSWSWIVGLGLVLNQSRGKGRISVRPKINHYECLQKAYYVYAMLCFSLCFAAMTVPTLSAGTSNLTTSIASLFIKALPSVRLKFGILLILHASINVTFLLTHFRLDYLCYWPSMTHYVWVFCSFVLPDSDLVLVLSCLVLTTTLHYSRWLFATYSKIISYRSRRGIRGAPRDGEQAGM